MKHIAKGTKLIAVGFRSDVARQGDITLGGVYEAIEDYFMFYNNLWVSVLNDKGGRFSCHAHRFEVIE